MIKAEELFNHPRLREGVVIQTSGAALSLEYRDQSCDVETPHRAATLSFLETLRSGGDSLATLRERRYDGQLLPVDQLVKEFDCLGLLTETSFPLHGKPVSGAQLYRELTRVARRVAHETASSRFFHLLREGRATRRQIIGYAIEYYQVVRLAPGLIGPALALANTRAVQHALQEFLRSELFHDKMLETSLAEVGIAVRDLEHVQPLPGTFALCASLGVFAKQHPLSFYGALFLFEEAYPEFHDALVNGCEKVGIGKAFYEPILRHASINDEFGHDNISRQLLKEVSAVSEEDALVTCKNIAILVETFARQEDDIIRYYGDDNRPLLRRFD
jgi:hypothetical protein